MIDFLDSDDDNIFQNLDPFFFTGDNLPEDSDETIDTVNDEPSNQQSDEVDVRSGPHWARRKRTRKVVSRMVRVSPRNQEKNTHSFYSSFMCEVLPHIMIF